MVQHDTAYSAYRAASEPLGRESLSRAFNKPSKRALGLDLLGFERIILLREIAESDDNYGSQYLGESRIYMYLLHEQLDKNIVEEKTDHHQDKISP